MAIKRKGNLTKEKILYYAKQEFYQNGYNDTQLKSIAEQAQLSLGNLNYYFKKKDDLVRAIYRQLFTEVYQFVEDNGVTDPLQKHAFFQFIVYSTVLTDEHNKRFYREIIQDKSNYRVMHELMREKYQDILNALNRQISPLDFEIILLSEFGSRREIFLTYFDGSLSLTQDQLVYYLIRNTCKNLDIPITTFTELIDLSHAFMAETDLSSIKFLI